MFARPRRWKDPATLAERAELLEQYKTARQIFKLPESQWESRLQLLPLDRQPIVRRCLELIKEHRQSSREAQA